MKPIAYIEVRSQKRVGVWPKCGPDTYVAVQIVPSPNVQPLTVLNKKVAKKRGIILIHCGEGYSKNVKTNRSTLNQAMDKANRITSSIND